MTRRASRKLTRFLILTTIVGAGAYYYKHHNATKQATANNIPAKAITKTAGEIPDGTNRKPVTMLAMADDKSLSSDNKTGNRLLTKPEVKLPFGGQPLSTPNLANGRTPGALQTNIPGDSTAKTPAKTIVPDTKPAAPDAFANAQLGAASVGSSLLISNARARYDSGELLAARKMLTEPLLNGELSASEALQAQKVISDANKILVFSTRRFADDAWAGTHQVTNGEVLSKIAYKHGCTTELLLQINGMTDARKLRANATIKVLNGPFHAIVTKHKFTIDLYLGSPGEKGSQYITSFLVGLGKDDSTPTGSWMVDQRIANPKWWGARGLPPIESGDPKNPLGKYWLSLIGVDGKAEGQQSYGIHGTIEPDSIGKQASMGCIRMNNDDAGVVYSLFVSGKSTVVVKE